MKIAKKNDIKKFYKKQKSLNLLIPELIDTSKSLSQEIKTRMKLRSMLSEFDSKASNELNFFINESNRRRLDSKFGIQIEKLLLNSKNRSLKEAYKIINDYCYRNVEIQKERETMQKKTTKNLHKNILKMIYKIKGINLNIKNKTNSNNDIKSEVSYRSDNNILSEREKLKLDSLEIQKVLNEDVQKIKNSILKYKNSLTTLKVKDKNSLLNLTPEEIYFERKKIKFELPSIKLLNFKKYVPPIKIIKPVNKQEIINKNKLMQYSKSVNNLICTRGEKKLENEEEMDIDPNTNNGIVLENAIKVFDSEKIYDNKSKEIENDLNINQIPNVSIYENIISNKFKQKKTNINKYINDYQKFLRMSKLEKTNVKIFRSLLKIYNYEKNNLFKHKRGMSY